MERVHYRRYTPSSRNNTEHERAYRARPYEYTKSNRDVNSSRPESAAGSSLKLRLLTQAVVSAFFLALVLGLGLLDDSEIRARLAVVLSYNIGTQQITEDVQGFLAQNFPSINTPPEILPEIVPPEVLTEGREEPPEEVLTEVMAEEILAEEIPVEIVLPEVVMPPMVLPAAMIEESRVIEETPSWLNPLHGYITSLFGTRTNPVTDTQEFHNGIDIAAAVGTPVAAARDATVAHVGYTALNGNYMRLRCSEGYDIVYAHLDEVLAEVGARVAQGDIVAYSGNTGLSTGPHLHFGIFKNGEMVDPLGRVDLPLSDAAAAQYAQR